MTEALPAEARLAEGWCPHPGHGRLERADHGGACATCGGSWRRAQFVPGFDLLLFEFCVKIGDHYAIQCLDPLYLTASALGSAVTIEIHTRKTRDYLVSVMP
jgi:hypothetical protein